MMAILMTDSVTLQKTINDRHHLGLFIEAGGSWTLGVMGQSLTFRTGARKTEMPVRMKTRIPVTLCSLVEMSTQSGVTWKTLSDQSQPVLLFYWIEAYYAQCYGPRRFLNWALPYHPRPG